MVVCICIARAFRFIVNIVIATTIDVHTPTFKLCTQEDRSHQVWSGQVLSVCVSMLQLGWSGDMLQKIFEF